MLKEVKTDIYHLLHPKVAFFLTSIGRDNRPNVMACAWATPVSEEPPIVIVCVAKESHTAKLIRQTKEFAINIPHKGQIGALMLCGKVTGKDTDKFKKAGLKAIKAKKVSVPLVGGCMGYIECQLRKTVDAGECYAFFGDVVSARADEKFIEKGLWKPSAGIPLHLGGSRMVYFG